MAGTNNRAKRSGWWLLMLMLSGCVGWQTGGDAGNAAEVQLEKRIRAALAESLAIPVEAAEYSRAQWQAAQQMLLLGAGFTAERKAQRALYVAARQHAQTALYERSHLREAMAQGGVPAALEHLQADDFDPAFIWATAIFYLFRDSYGLLEKIISRQQLANAKAVIEAIRQREPGWEEGVLQFSLGIYYLAAPTWAGGDRELAAALMAEGVRIGERRLAPRWGRGKYLAVELNDAGLFHADLQWVVDQQLTDLNGPPLWNEYFQLDAARLLRESAHTQQQSGGKQ